MPGPSPVQNDNKKDDRQPELGGTRRDVGVSLVKGAVGAVPFVGSLFGELIGIFIPEQRIERIEAYLKLLNERLAGMEEADVRSRLTRTENIDLFEDGAFQSIRAVSNERKEYIANLVANGISGEAQQRLESKRLLKLLGELDDAEIILLASMLSKNTQNEAFWNRHAKVLLPIAPALNDTQEDFDAESIQNLADAHLQRLGLSRLRYKRPSKNEIPEFDDNTGTLKGSGRELTPLGRLLLRRIGVAGDQDF